MKILYLTPGCFDKGGVSRYTRFQITALREVCGPPAVEALSVLGPDHDSIEEPFEVSWSAGGITKRHKLSFVRRAFASLVARRPDAVLAAHVNLAGLARVLATAAGASAIVNVYGYETWSGYRLDAGWGLKAADHVISDCHFTARHIEDSGTRPPRSTAVVWDCVDTDRFSPGQPGAAVLERYGIPDPATGINVMTLGRIMKIAAYKGYDRLLSAFAGVARDLPRMRLIFAGRGDLIPALERRARALGLGERVVFTGAIHEEHLPDVYRSAHVFSLVADQGKDRGEGLPLTPLEASACGIPILVGDQDGSREAVLDGITGYALPPLDLSSLSERLARLATQPDLRAMLGAAARRRAEQEFDQRRFVEQHRSLLDAWFPARSSPAARR